MGTKVAPTYAIIFMNWFEEKYVYTYKQKPRVWFRFIDDVWGVFRGTESEMKEFIDHLNRVHESIKFTAEYSKKQVVFLDMITMVDSTKRISTTLYVKPTDNHGYLDFSSSHPIHNKTSIPYSQFLRIKHNCSEWEYFAEHSLKMCIHLSLRGYPNDLIYSSLMRVAGMEREDLIRAQPKKSSEKKQIFCIIDFNPYNPDIKTIINKHWPILERSSSTRSLLDYNITVGYRKPKNLGDILCRTDISQISLNEKNNLPLCPLLGRCGHCPRLNKTGRIMSHSTGHKYKTHRKITCRSSNLIYCIECKWCSKQYVGQTKNQLSVCMNNHISSIKNHMDTPLARHMNREHSVEVKPPIKVTILQLMRTENSHQRDKWENIWIARLNSISRLG